MFGYLVTNNEILNKEQKELYQKYYCGLCHCLHEKYGNVGRMSLTYDFTFMTILLSDIKKVGENTIKENCPIHPIVKQELVFNQYSQYFADMNIYISYYKYLDDVNDDKSISAKIVTKKLEQYLLEIEYKYPKITSFIKEKLAYISNLEKDNILNPDLGSNAFGEIMATILNVIKNEDLKCFGFHLGRFIYLVDAVIDLEKDIKTKSYNPLITFDSCNFEDMLMMVMEDVDTYYKKLPFRENKDVLDNVIYSGIWTKYQLYKKKKGKSL